MNQICGLVESFSGDYFCILCYATREEMHRHHKEDLFTFVQFISNLFYVVQFSMSVTFQG